MMNFIRPALRRCGITMSPASVICSEHLKTITIDVDGRARVDVRETLVFLHQPKSGDLYDSCSIDPKSPLSSFIRQSPDATDTGQRLIGKDTVVVDWKPKGAIVPYALYDHQYSWYPEGSHTQPDDLLSDCRADCRAALRLRTNCLLRSDFLPLGPTAS